MKRKLLAISLGLLSTVVLAGVDVATPPGDTCKHGFSPTVTDWLFNGLFGYGNNTGNTSNSNMNGALNLTYSPKQWEYILGLTMQYSSQDHVRTAEKYTESLQTRYHFAPKENYYYALLNGTQNPFGTYDRTYLGSLGYGWTIIDNCKFYFLWQVGPGFRYQRIQNTQETSTRPAAFTQANFNWYLTDTTTFSQTVGLEYTKINTYVQSVTALNTSLIKNFGIQFAYEVDHNTNIPAESTNKKKTDTTTTVSLTYTFKS